MSKIFVKPRLGDDGQPLCVHSADGSLVPAAGAEYDTERDPFGVIARRIAEGDLVSADAPAVSPAEPEPQPSKARASRAASPTTTPSE